MRNLVDAGVLSGARGAYRLVRQPDGIEVPASVAAIIAARIDRLSAAEKTALQLAAVIGEDVPLALLEAVVRDAGGGAAWRARRSARRASSCTRRVCSRTSPTPSGTGSPGASPTTACVHESRRALHARIAEALEARHADHLDEVVETLAHHFEHGAVWPKAAAYFLRAADKAKQRYTYPTALEFAQRARGIAERDPALEAARLQALELQGDLHSLIGELEAANQSYDAAQRAGDRRRGAPAHRAQAAPRRLRAARRRPDRLLPARRRRGDAAVRQSRRLRPRGVPADRRAAVPGVPHRHDRPARHRRIGPAAASLWPQPARPGRARRDRAGRDRRHHRRRHLARQQPPGPARRYAPRIWCAGWS